MAAGRKALVVATYRYADSGLRQLTAPEQDAEAFAGVLQDPEIAGFDVTMLVNQPSHVVGEAIADFYGDCRRDDLTLLYFSGHGLKDDEGRLHLAMTNTRREALLFTAISAAQLNEAMDACASRRKVLILDCCYSGAFPAGRTAKADEGVQTLERFQGKGRAVLTASDATQYAFEGDALSGSASSSVFTRHLVEAIRSGAADLDEDGDIALDELYSYVRERVVAEMPQQRPKKQEDVDGRIVIARNVHWTLPAHLQHAIESPIAVQRLGAVEGLAHLHRAGNDVVRAAVLARLQVLAEDDSRSVSAAATAALERIGGQDAVRVAAPPPPPVAPPPATPPTPPDPVADPEPDAEHSLADWVRVDGGPVAAPAPAPETPPPLPGDRPEAAFPVARFLGLIAVAAVFLVLSRVIAFEGPTSIPVTDVTGLAAVPWVLWVGPSLVAATLLVQARDRGAWPLALAVGLVAGTALVQLAQLLIAVAYFSDPDSSYDAGPDLWLAQPGTAALVACVVLALRHPPLQGGGGGINRSWRGALAVVVLVAALVAWVTAFADFYLSTAAIGPAFLMAAAGLAVAVLSLTAMQRLAGLAAITVLGGWLATGTLHSLVVDTYWSDRSDGVTVAVSALVSVAACYLAQAGTGRRAGDPAAGSAPRR